MMNSRTTASRAAFSLIEAIAVVAIMAALLAIAFPALGNARRSARDLQCRVKLRDYGVFVHATLARQGRLPAYVANSVGLDFFLAAAGHDVPEGRLGMAIIPVPEARCPLDQGAFDRHGTSYSYVPNRPIGSAIINGGPGTSPHAAAATVTASYERSISPAELVVVGEIATLGRPPHHEGGPPSALGEHALYFDGSVDWRAR